MSRERALVLLVGADVFLAFTRMGVEAFFSWTLPGPLRDYVHWSGGVTFHGVGLLALWGLTATCAIAAWIGLLNYWWFARRLYVAALIATLTLMLCSGPAVDTPVGAMLDTVNSLIGGMILGLVYFSDLSRRFERSSARVTDGARASV